VIHCEVSHDKQKYALNLLSVAVNVSVKELEYVVNYLANEEKDFVFYYHF
jgi:hypothetical protein